jgi:predicted signal transduction protein with EAL and GGDEF domain
LLGNILRKLQSPTPFPGETPPHTSPFGRIRSDLLVVLLFGMPDRQIVAEAADRIRRALAEPLASGEKSAQLRPSLGLAQFPQDGTTPQSLLESARAALANARQSDHDSTIVFCTRTMQLPRVDRIEHDAGARAMCESVVSIARAFGLRSIGVGVENSSQLDFLATIGCEAVQGRFVGEPMALDPTRPAQDRMRIAASRARRI